MVDRENVQGGDYESLYASYLDLAKQVDHLSTLREIGLAVNSTLDLNEALTTIAKVVQGALDVRRVTIFQLDREAGVLRPAIARYGDDLITKERLNEEDVSLYGNPMGEAIESHRVILVASDIQDAAYIPLIAKNAPLGVLRLEDPRDDEPFSQDDAALFQLLGSQIALALNNAQLYALAVTDGLTALYVRRYFDLRMEEEFDQARRYRRSFSLLLFDIDHFKKLNDTYGHQSGDRVLQQFAALLESNTRRSDICCRYGGEEIAIILPETKLEEAVLLANKLCNLIRTTPFHGTRGRQVAITASVGVAAYLDEHKEPEDLIKAVDAALYRAKELGRNRVEAAGC